MANDLMASYAEAQLNADIDPPADTIKLLAVDATYTFNAAHDNLDDVGSGARVATSSALTTKTATSGYFNSDDVLYSSLPGGDTITQLFLFKDTGVESTSKLIAYYDTNAAAAAISQATNGGDIQITPNAQGWYRI